MMRRVIVNLLAVVGAISVIGTGVQWRRARTASSVVALHLHDADNQPLTSAAVFLDRGFGALERVQADAHGVATLPLQYSERRHVRWLICAPGFRPVAGRSASDAADTEDYELGRATEPDVFNIRSSGWMGPIPRECPQTVDSAMWQVPWNGQGVRPSSTPVEPVWDAER